MRLRACESTLTLNHPKNNDDAERSHKMCMSLKYSNASFGMLAHVFKWWRLRACEQHCTLNFERWSIQSREVYPFYPDWNNEMEEESRSGRIIRFVDIE